MNATPDAYPFGILPAPAGLDVRSIRAYLPGETKVGLRARWQPVVGASHYAVQVTTRAGGSVRLRTDVPEYEWVAQPAARYRVRVSAVSLAGVVGEASPECVTVPCLDDADPP